MSAQRYGDIPRWRQALKDLPTLDPATIQLNAPRVGCQGPIRATQRADLETALRWLYNPGARGLLSCLACISIPSGALTGNGIDCYRGSNHSPVDGYWMSGAVAATTVGECWALERRKSLASTRHRCSCFSSKRCSSIVGKRISTCCQPRWSICPRPLKAFDSVFSMGVLYHRRSPIDHLTRASETHWSVSGQGNSF